MVPPPNNNLQQQQQHLNCQPFITTLKSSIVTRRDATPQFSYDHDYVDVPEDGRAQDEQ